MKRQIRLTVTMSESEFQKINAEYARYLLSDEEQLSRNRWIKSMIMQKIEEIE